MLDNHARYVYEVYRSRSVSEAARKLYISQPALSASIKKAEQELGMPIFNRKTTPFSLTPEGKLYIRAIEKIMSIEEETKNSILDISELKQGTLRIGTSTNLSSYFLPVICYAFRNKYPNIDISIVLDTTQNLSTLVEKDMVDIIITSSDECPRECIFEELFAERCIVVANKNFKGIAHLLPYGLSREELLSGNYDKSRELSDFSVFDGVEFLYTPPSSTLYNKKKSFIHSGSGTPSVMLNRGSFMLNYKLMLMGFGALFTTDCNIAARQVDDSCVYFAVNSPEAYRSYVLAYKSKEDHYVFRIIDEFIKVAKSVFAGNSVFDVLTCSDGDKIKLDEEDIL